MSDSRLLLVTTLALAVVTAGCAGFSPPGETAPAAATAGSGTGGTGSLAGSEAPGDGPGPAGNGPGVPTPSLDIHTPSWPRNTTELYRETIDSVVEITVRSARGKSQGSGFVYSQAGYIVTNRHVVGSAERVQIRFRNGTWKLADVVGTDVYTDLAVVQVDSLPPGIDALPVARDDPQPGQPVVALGSPFGYEGSITHGIVSGVNRSMRTAQGFAIPDTVQTDAAINPGNSGGPLVSMNGTVVGVNRAKQGDNLGFAISADVVRQVVPSLIQQGAYHHAYLGIRTATVTPVIAEANGMTRARGVMVVGVKDGGPADGVLSPARLVRTDAGATLPVDGDVIVAIGGRPVDTHQDLAQYLLLRTEPGGRVSLTVLRDGRRVETTVELGRRPELSTTGPV